MQFLSLVENTSSPKGNNYLYIIEFENATIVQRIVINSEDKIAAIKNEADEVKSNIHMGIRK